MTDSSFAFAGTCDEIRATLDRLEVDYAALEDYAHSPRRRSEVNVSGGGMANPTAAMALSHGSAKGILRKLGKELRAIRRRIEEAATTLDAAFGEDYSTGGQPGREGDMLQQPLRAAQARRRAQPWPAGEARAPKRAVSLSEPRWAPPGGQSPDRPSNAGVASTGRGVGHPGGPVVGPTVRSRPEGCCPGCGEALDWSADRACSRNHCRTCGVRDAVSRGRCRSCYQFRRRNGRDRTPEEMLRDQSGTG